MTECRTCALIPLLLGKSIMMPLLGHHYAKLMYAELAPHLFGLDLVVVGGLKNRGWTLNDIDVRGTKFDVVVLAQRLQNADIRNPIHYCGTYDFHSHISCAYYGVKLALTGRGY